MRTTTLDIGGRAYAWPAAATPLLVGVRSLLAEEERRALRLLPHLPGTPEHLLVHQVRMYLFRFAIPAIEIETGDLSAIALERVRTRLWLCMLGRGLDDLVDGDSRLFTPAGSAVLLATYAGALAAVGAAATPDALAAAARQPDGSAPVLPRFDEVAADVCPRVAYFLEPTERDHPDRAALLRAYLGVTLGRPDLDDALADDGAAATLLSRSLRTLADDEGKVRLGPPLFTWYAAMAKVLAAGGATTARQLRGTGATFAAGIVDQEVRGLASARAELGAEARC